MKLWTIQSRSVLRSLEKEGVLGVREDSRHHVPYAYRWLSEQLTQRGVARFQGGLPWWFHPQNPLTAWQTTALPSQPRDEDELVIEVDLPPDRVFTMPCWAWDRVLTGNYLARQRSDELRWRRRVRRAHVGDFVEPWLEREPAPLPEPLEGQRRRSYEALFTARLPRRPWRHAIRLGYSRLKRTESVTEFLRVEDVVRIWESRAPPRTVTGKALFGVSRPHPRGPM